MLDDYLGNEGLFLVSSTIWNKDPNRGGAGFIVSKANASILVVGCSFIQPQTNMDAKSRLFWWL